MTLRRVLIGLLIAVAVLVMAVLGGLVALFAPPFLDDRALDRIVAVVVLDWRDFGEDRARERLWVELDRERINPAVGDESCSFQQEDGARRVACHWATEVVVPVTGHVVPLAFESVAVLGVDGRVR